MRITSRAASIVLAGGLPVLVFGARLQPVTAKAEAAPDNTAP
jgi:hypothetical protein